MVEQKYGKIVNIASIAGAVIGYMNLGTLFCKQGRRRQALLNLWRLKWLKYGININAIAPGPIDVGAIPSGSEIYQQIIKTIPIGRMGLPLDIANLIVFLASDESSFITGQCIVFDGGYSIP